MFQKVSQKQINNKTILSIENEAKMVSPVNIKSSMDKGYFITCDSANKKHPCYKIFDLNGISYENNSWQSENTQFPHWIKWTNPTKRVIVNRYSIKMPVYFGGGYSQDNIDTNVKAWTFEGSNDGSNWQILDKVLLDSNIGNGNFIIRKLDNDQPYLYFKFVFTRNFSAIRNDISVGFIKCWYFEEE